MSFLDSIISAGSGAAVRQLGSQLGLDEPQTASALSALVSALSIARIHGSRFGRSQEELLKEDQDVCR